MSITRREFAVGGSLLVAASSLNRMARAHVLTPSAHATASEERVLFRPKNPRFSQLLSTFFPGFAALPFAPALLPFAAIVRNGGIRPVRSYTYWWRGTTADGKEMRLSRPFYSELSKRGLAVSASGVNDILQPGEFAVVTPLFFWSSYQYLKKRDLGHLTLPNTVSEEVSTFLGEVDPKSVKMKRGYKIQRFTARVSLDDGSAARLETIQSAEQYTAINAFAWLRSNPNADALEFATKLEVGAFTPANLSDLGLDASKRWAAAIALGTKRVTALGMFTRLNQVSLQKLNTYVTIPAARST